MKRLDCFTVELVAVIAALRADIQSLVTQVTNTPPKSTTIRPIAAEQAAIDYVTQAGLEGTATVNGDTITITATGTYHTKFINLIGIQTLTYQATASATLINNPNN